MRVPPTLANPPDLEAGVAYPGGLLEGCEDALILFAAAFGGKQDAYWIKEAGLTATCVDRDIGKLVGMQSKYPVDWEWWVADAFKLPGEMERDVNGQRGRTWDVVSLDPWTQDFQRCADHLATWCALARRAVILGTGWNTKVEPPDGWRVTDVRKRSDYDGGVYWSVLEPA